MDKKDAIRGISQLQFEVTNRCNLKCSICWRALRPEDSFFVAKDISLGKFKIALDKFLGEFCIKEVNTQGLGEPLLCPDILKILQYVKAKNLIVWFVSNGVSIDDHMARELVEIGVDKIRISVDTADPEMYSKIKCGSSLNEICKNIALINLYKRKLKKDCPAVSFNCVLLKEAIDEMDRLLVMAHNLNVREITFIPLVNFLKGKATADNQVDLYSQDFNKRFNLLKARAQTLDIDLNIGVSMETKESRYCKYGFFIDVDGFVHPCCNILNYNFGNIFEDSVGVILDKYIEFRDYLDNQQLNCKECNKLIDNNKTKTNNFS